MTSSSSSNDKSGDISELVSIVQGSSTTSTSDAKVYVSEAEWEAAKKLSVLVADELQKTKTRLDTVPGFVNQKLKDLNIKQMVRNSVSKRVEDVKDKLFASLISVFGIFASIVSFLLVEIQVFKELCDPLQMIGLSLLLAFVLLTFLGMLLTFYNKVRDGSIGIVLVVALSLIGVGGAVMIFMSPNLGRECTSDVHLNLNDGGDVYDRITR